MGWADLNLVDLVEREHEYTELGQLGQTLNLTDVVAVQVQHLERVRVGVRARARSRAGGRVRARDAVAMHLERPHDELR